MPGPDTNLCNCVKTYYEERAKALDSVIEKFKQPSTFEEFISHVYSPSQLGTIIQGNLRSAGTSTASVANTRWVSAVEMARLMSV